MVTRIKRLQEINRKSEDEKKHLQLEIEQARMSLGRRLGETEREVTAEEGKALAEQWGVPFFETSAKTKINDHEVFYEIVREIRKFEEEKLKEKEEEMPKKKPFKCNIL